MSVKRKVSDSSFSRLSPVIGNSDQTNKKEHLYPQGPQYPQCLPRALKIKLSSQTRWAHFLLIRQIERRCNWVTLGQVKLTDHAEKKPSNLKMRWKRTKESEISAGNQVHPAALFPHPAQSRPQKKAAGVIKSFMILLPLEKSSLFFMIFNIKMCNLGRWSLS